MKSFARFSNRPEKPEGMDMRTDRLRNPVAPDPNLSCVVLFLLPPDRVTSTSSARVEGFNTKAKP